LKPDNVIALNFHGCALLLTKKPQLALESFDKAIAVHPALALTNYNRGEALFELRLLDAALAAYDKAIALAPTDAKTWQGRGKALHQLKRNDEAVAAFERALALNPDLADGWAARGNVFVELDRREEALADYARALSLKPDLKYVPGALLQAKMYICDWSGLPSETERVLSMMRQGSLAATPFVAVSLPSSPADQLRCARLFMADQYPAAIQPIWAGERYAHDKIRIAYLSADFYDHATAWLTRGLFEQHDRNSFEIIAISFGPDRNDDMRARLRPLFGRFVDAQLESDEQIAKRLREMEVDIAVDLKGLTQDCRPGILARRPAPLQVNYLGYPGTMGVDYVDYVIGDRFVIPPEHHEYFSEKVVCLPDSYQANDDQRRIAATTTTRDSAGLPSQGFVFCCFNNNFKLTPDLFDIWMRLLQQVDGSVLWLLEGNPAAARNLRKEAEKRGVSADRLVFAARAKHEDHLARHRLADMFLDTLPYNAHTTASDALWAGLPVLTCLGNAFAGRVGASLLNAVGLPELVAHSLQDYEALALKLAQDPGLLASLKEKLGRNRTTHPLFDTKRFTRYLETAYRVMWERQQRNERPASFAVSPDT
jgi:predicted O-linked N-acetylglucosamine transferase (SPINDLY family)